MMGNRLFRYLTLDNQFGLLAGPECSRLGGFALGRRRWTRGGIRRGDRREQTRVAQIYRGRLPGSDPYLTRQLSSHAFHRQLGPQRVRVVRSWLESRSPEGAKA